MTPTSVLEKFRSVLVLEAHPDDEIALAGTLHRLKASGANLSLHTFSMCLDLNTEELIEEYHRATKDLFDNVRTQNLPNRELPVHRQAILNRLDEYNPDDFDLIFVPATWDAHQDHATVSQEGIRRFKHNTILGYEHPQNTVGPSHINAYVPLEPKRFMEREDYIDNYQTQKAKPYMSPEATAGVCSLRGMQVGTRYAEGFEVIRLVL